MKTKSTIPLSEKRPPAIPSERLIQDRIWLTALQSGRQGKSAIVRANKALSEYIRSNDKQPEPFHPIFYNAKGDAHGAIEKP